MAKYDLIEVQVAPYEPSDPGGGNPDGGVFAFTATQRDAKAFNPFNRNYLLSYAAERLKVWA